MKILFVEDNKRLQSLVVPHLEGAGFVVDWVGCASDAEAALLDTEYDAMLLDLGLPDADGSSLLAQARRKAANDLPVIILTARDELEERLRLLNDGADDFILKPFDLLELEARLRAVLRRPGVRSSEVLTFEDLTFDIRTREAHAAGRQLEVARRELSLLEELMRAKGRIVVREALEDRLYAFSEPVTPNALEQAISRLRRGLKEIDSHVGISTKRGIGYQLMNARVATR